MLTPHPLGQNLFGDILDMHEELSLTLPTLKIYENTLPIDRALETALLDVYTEVICFYARLIHFFRTHARLVASKRLGRISVRFRSDNPTQRMSSIAESEANLARMRVEDVKYKEVLGLMDDLKKSKIHDESAIRCHHTPSEPNPRF